jgi:hypothetical protein
MLRNRWSIILGALFILLVLGLGLLSMKKKDRESSGPPVAEITWCYENTSGLCLVSFGADSTDRMLMNFKLPNLDYPKFYVKGLNKDVANVYSCEMDQIDQTSVQCAGVRTPLGETIDVEVYLTDSDLLYARGRFVVSTLLVSTPTIGPTSSTTPTKSASLTAPTSVNPLTPSASAVHTRPVSLSATPKPGTGYP